MAYTRTWNNATPAGTRAAKEIDDAIREAKVDIYDRIISLLDTENPDTPATIDDDPLVLKPMFSGKVKDKQLLIGPHILVPKDDDDDVTRLEQYYESDNDALAFAYGTIIIPVGYTIKLFEGWMDKNGATSCTMELSAINVTTGGITSLGGPITRSSAGIGVLTTAALAYVVQATDVFVVRTSHTGGARYRAYGFRMTYDRTSSDQSY
jgi:hypothetical protein